MLTDSPRHPRLVWLDRLAASLGERQDVVAVLGLGSTGVQQDRFDDCSDLDFFVIVDDADTKRRFLGDIGWLAQTGDVAFSFVNDANGRKALLHDGTLLEYAIFTAAELPGIPFADARVVWQRADAPDDLAGSGRSPQQPSVSTVEFHLDEALTNLVVGLQRERRGERLNAFRFIQVFAVDRILALLRLSGAAPGHRIDPFEPTRRVEAAHDAELLPLASMVPGYEHNVAAARFTYGWLAARWAIHPALATAVELALDSSRDH